jgi:hypothetical protein
MRKISMILLLPLLLTACGNSELLSAQDKRNNFDACKKELRKCFLQKIKEIRFDEGYKTKRKFKIWP